MAEQIRVDAGAHGVFHMEYASAPGRRHDSSLDEDVSAGAIADPSQTGAHRHALRREAAHLGGVSIGARRGGVLIGVPGQAAYVRGDVVRKQGDAVRPSDFVEVADEGEFVYLVHVTVEAGEVDGARAGDGLGDAVAKLPVDVELLSRARRSDADIASCGVVYEVCGAISNI